MDKELVVTLVQVAAPVVLGGIGFFMRAYFKRLEADISELGRQVSRLEGQLLTLGGDLRKNTVETARTSAQVESLWKIRDNWHIEATNGPA